MELKLYEEIGLYQPIDYSGRVSSNTIAVATEPLGCGSLAFFIEQKQKEKGEYRLIFKFLKQNLMDAGFLRHGNGRKNINKRIWKDAVKWFLENSERPYSFRWICHGFMIIPESALSNLKQIKCKKCKKVVMREFCTCKWNDT